MLTIKPYAGLCNRMRVIDSALGIARNNKTRIRIIWENDISLNCDFNKLFITPPGVEVVIKKRLLPNALVKIKRRLIKLLREQKVNFPFGYDNYLFEKEIKALKNIGYDFKTLNTTENIYIETEHRFFENNNPFTDLVPIRYIQDKITKCTEQFNSHTIGVHIRRGDHKRSIAESPLELFIEMMRKETMQNKKVCFFLATDSPETEELIRRIFPHRIISNKKTLNRDSTEGIQDALVDLVCLSKTQKILGSYWSSFSESAASIGKIELVVVRKNPVEALVTD